MGSQLQYSTVGKIYIEGISQDMTDQTVRGYFGGYGEVTEVTLLRVHGTGQLTGYGFVGFADPEIIHAVLNNSGHTINNKLITVKRASLSAARVEKLNKEGKRLFAGGLPLDLTEKEFRTYFEDYGRLLDTRLLTGYGFVTFDSKASANLALGNHELKGKPFEVKQATWKVKSSNIDPARPSASSGGGRGQNINLGSEAANRAAGWAVPPQGTRSGSYLSYSEAVVSGRGQKRKFDGSGGPPSYPAVSGWNTANAASASSVPFQGSSTVSAPRELGPSYSDVDKVYNPPPFDASRGVTFGPVGEGRGRGRERGNGRGGNRGGNGGSSTAGTTNPGSGYAPYRLFDDNPHGFVIPHSGGGFTAGEQHNITGGGGGRGGGRHMGSGYGGRGGGRHMGSGYGTGSSTGKDPKSDFYYQQP